MPIYEYQCQSCGHNLEALQKISDEPLTRCPQCQKDALKKLVSAAGFRLKGSGWYETDFKSGSKKNLSENESSKSSSNGSSSSSSTGSTSDSGSSKTDSKTASSSTSSNS